jgi:hypothetical protein
MVNLQEFFSKFSIFRVVCRAAGEKSTGAVTGKRKPPAFDGPGVIGIFNWGHVVIRDQAGSHLRDGDVRLPTNVRIIDLPP